MRTLRPGRRPILELSHSNNHDILEVLLTTTNQPLISSTSGDNIPDHFTAEAEKLSSCPSHSPPQVFIYQEQLAMMVSMIFPPGTRPGIVFPTIRCRGDYGSTFKEGGKKACTSQTRGEYGIHAISFSVFSVQNLSYLSPRFETITSHLYLNSRESSCSKPASAISGIYSLHWPYDYLLIRQLRQRRHHQRQQSKR